jgi:hypothetical protein
MQYAMIFRTKQELDEAEAILTAAKSGGAGQVPESASTAQAGRLEAALRSAPLNAQKATVLKTWLSAPEGEWVPYADVVRAFGDVGLADSSEQATNRASAAIRDLSWQVAQTLPKSDLEGFSKAIEALASRSRSSGAFSYRLTPAGRIATAQFLTKTGAA